MEIVFGLFERHDERLHNSAALIGSNGLVGIDRKRHRS